MQFGQATAGKVKAVAIVMIALVAVTIGSERGPLGVGTPMPEVSGKTLGGAEASLGDFSGKVVLVHFFATWCGPCMAEFPKVKWMSEDLVPQGLEILSVSLDDDRDKLARFLDNKSVDWDVLYSGRGWADPNGQRLNVRSIPWMAVVDANGKVALQTNSADAAEKKIRELLAGPVGHR